MSTESGRSMPLEGLTVAVVGAGSIGSELIRNLSLMGVGRIDVFERERRIADSLRSRYAVYEGDFWDALTLSRLQTYDFAACTVSGRRARQRMNQKCLVANVNMVQVNAEGSLASVSAYPFAAFADSACAECDASRAAVALPIASLKLSVREVPAAAAPATRVATASVAGALAAALLARIAAGAHGSLARRATLDASSGQGASLEIRRDPHCPRCRAVQRPVPIVQTRNRWEVPASVAQACPEMLNQTLRLSDDIEGLPVDSYSVRELVTRFNGGPIPAKFALTEVGGRTVCLDFEECESGSTPAASRPAAGRHSDN